jgi:hypothetical protein
LEGEDLVDHLRHGGIARFLLLGNAGSDEHAAGLFAVGPLDRQGRGDHWRDDGNEALGQLGVVLADVLHHGRTRGGDAHTIVVIAQPGAVGPAHSVRALRHFDHVPETELAQGSYQCLGFGVWEVRWEGRCQQRSDRRARREQFHNPVHAAVVGLGALGADYGAVAAGNASLTHDRRLAVDDPDGLGRAISHAL